MKHHILETIGAVLIGLTLSAPVLFDFLKRG